MFEKILIPLVSYIFYRSCKQNYLKIQKQRFTDRLLGTLKNFGNFSGKIHVLESLFKKASGPQACKFIKKRLQHRYFPVKLAKFSRTLFLQNTSGGWFLKWEAVTFCSKIFQGYLLRITNPLQLATLTMTNYIWKCIHLPKSCFDRAFL